MNMQIPGAIVIQIFKEDGIDEVHKNLDSLVAAGVSPRGVPLILRLTTPTHTVVRVQEDPPAGLGRLMEALYGLFNSGLTQITLIDENNQSITMAPQHAPGRNNWHGQMPMYFDAQARGFRPQMDRPFYPGRQPYGMPQHMTYPVERFGPGWEHYGGVSPGMAFPMDQKPWDSKIMRQTNTGCVVVPTDVRFIDGRAVFFGMVHSPSESVTTLGSPQPIQMGWDARGQVVSPHGPDRRVPEVIANVFHLQVAKADVFSRLLPGGAFRTAGGALVDKYQFFNTDERGQRTTICGYVNAAETGEAMMGAGVQHRIDATRLRVWDQFGFYMGSVDGTAGSTGNRIHFVDISPLRQPEADLVCALMFLRPDRPNSN